MNLDLFIAHLRSFFLLLGWQMDSKKTAQKIRKLNSGASNFEHIEHGSTRRQLSLDEEKRYSGYSK